MIDRKKIKEEAKKRIENNLWNIWKPYLVVYLISMLLGIFTGYLFTDESVSTIVGSLAEVLLLPMSVGIIYYVIKFVRGKEFQIEDIFTYYNFNSFMLIICVSFLVGIFTMLWGCLFIVPGVIAALSYSMVFYLFIDNNESSPLKLIKESKLLMKGHKWDYFVFGLSFFGWILLCVFIVPIVYVYPYITVSNALYYEELRKINVNN